MPSPSPLMDLTQLRQAVSRTGKDLQHLRDITQRVSQQIRDLARQTELRPEIVAKRQSEVRQRGVMEAESYVKSELISQRLEAIASQPAHRGRRGSESHRTALNLMKHTLEREGHQPAAVQEAKVLIAEAERLGIRIDQTLFAIRTGEDDLGLKVDMISEERQRQAGAAWEAGEHTNPHTLETGDASQGTVIKAGPRGKRA
jgi:hypothetical protein